jgi:hypothetical protein
MAKVTIVSISEDQNTVTLSNGIVLKAVESKFLTCRGCYIGDSDMSCAGFYFCTHGGEDKIYVIDESKCVPLEVVIDGRKFTAENTTDAKWLKERLEKQVEVK